MIGSLVFLATSSCIYSYFFTSLFTITTYDIQGIDDDSRAHIDATLHTLLTKKTIQNVFNDKIFTYSSSLITDTIRTISPNVGSVEMRPVGLHTVNIVITTLSPLFRISETQALTADGIVFTTKEDIRSYPLLTLASSTTLVVKLDGFPLTQIVVGDIPVHATYLRMLDEMSTQVSRIIFPVTTIVVEEEDAIFLSASSTSKVMIRTDMDPKKVWSTIVSAIDTEPLKSKLATNRGGLEYLDVRYGNKVFYKFNDMPDTPFGNIGGTGILGHHGTTTEATTSVPH